MKRTRVVALLGVLMIAAWLFAWPVPIDPQPRTAIGDRGLNGPHESNARLRAASFRSLGEYLGPEHIVAQGEREQLSLWLAVATADAEHGRILRWDAADVSPRMVVDTGGRPLGFELDARGALIVADPLFGDHGALLRVSGTGVEAKIEMLTDRISADDLIAFADAVAVAADGRIYFTDATRFGPKAWGGMMRASVLDALEMSCSGRVLEFDPPSRRTRIVAGGLCFANGIVMSADQQHVLVAETFAYRVWKIDRTADQLQLDAAAGTPPTQARIVLDRLPGFPDNLSRGEAGRVWVGLVEPRNPVLDYSADKPWLRRLLARLPQALLPLAPRRAHLIAFNEDGEIIADLQDDSGTLPPLTGATEAGGKLYLQSLEGGAVGVLDWPTAPTD